MPYSHIHFIWKPYLLCQSYSLDQCTPRNTNKPQLTPFRIQMLVKMRRGNNALIRFFLDVKHLWFLVNLGSGSLDGQVLFDVRHIAHWTNVSFCNTTQKGPQTPWHWLVSQWDDWEIGDQSEDVSKRAAHSSETCFGGLWKYTLEKELV